MSMILNPYRFGGSGADPFYANVTALLNMDVADGTTFPDAKGRTWVPSGDAQVIAQWYVGDGLGDWLSHSGMTTDFQMGTGDFTFEGFIQTSAMDDIILDNRASGDTGLVMYTKAGTGYLGAFCNRGSSVEVLGSAPVTDNVPHHFAFSRVSGTLFVCLDGVVSGSGSMANDLNASGKLTIGAGDGGLQPLAGKLRGIRVTKGVGRYSGAYVVPSWPLPTF